MRFSRLGYWGLMGAGIGLIVLGIFVINHTLPGGPTPTKGLMVGAVVMLGAVIAMFSYRNADEVIMSTHKTAWFWGSMATCCVFAPLAIAISWRLIPIPMLLPRHEVAPGDYFVEGMLCFLLLQLLGYLAVSAYHQIKRTGQ